MSKRISIAGLLFTAAVVLLFFARPPGEPPLRAEEHEEASANETSLNLSYGSLPGVTWLDDIHPIFVKNKCGHCHTRGSEAIVEGFEELALGIIDPDDENNAFYSYHELVYAEGPPQIQEGETLRDGQCCWPRSYPDEKKRRIWIGHAERSVLVRKLEQDYFDWDRPPRFIEEGLRLKWGPPMPMYREGGHGDDGSEVQGQRQYDIRPFYKRILLNLSLWLGGSRDELRQWPPKIPERDRLLLRHWINNAVQLMEEGTGIEVEVINNKGNPVNNAEIRLVGNYSSTDKREVKDQLFFKADSDGKVLLLFPEFSVITLNWYVSAEKNRTSTEFIPLIVQPGQVNKVNVKMK